MGLIDRIRRIVRANFNSLLAQAEDPEKILEQTIDEMQQDLIRMRQAVAGAIASQKRTERQAKQAQSLADEWYQNAQLALSQGDESLARSALGKRKSFQETAKVLQAQLAQQGSIVSKLKQDMRTLESKISEAKTKTDLYIARARSAQASQKINEMLGNLSTGKSLVAFERMEEKVMQLEAQSEAISELGSDELEKKFAAIESSDDIDADLAVLKANMINDTELTKLPSSQGKDGQNSKAE